MNSLIQIENLKLQFQSNQQPIIDELNLQIEKNKVTVILGPSGCGKTSLLRLIAGLSKASQGLLRCHTEHIGYVFQEHSLLPWLTVEENILLPSMLQNKQKQTEIDLLLKWVRLNPETKNKFPHELSGGMKMRTSVARALCGNTDLLLLDEPFSALDEYTREQLQLEMKQLQQEKKITVVMVTHSLTEALLMADRILMMNKNGKVFFDYQDPRSLTKRDLQKKWKEMIDEES